MSDRDEREGEREATQGGPLERLQALRVRCRQGDHGLQHSEDYSPWLNRELTRILDLERPRGSRETCLLCGLVRHGVAHGPLDQRETLELGRE